MVREWLKLLREKEGLTHEGVAEAANIKRAYYTMIESGTRTPSVKVARSIGSALNFEWTLFFDNQCNETKHKPA
ncbi:helix-turn-helix transcriptional regulator [Bacillus tianshenii]|nr:helix-turn-helix transcriptional regulator [Bacillus tianshenii]